jgi:CBS domain containing-hemolysin-like protein
VKISIPAQLDTQGTLAEQQRKAMMQRVFDFGDTTVEEILVPLSGVDVLEKGTSIEAR